MHSLDLAARAVAEWRRDIGSSPVHSQPSASEIRKHLAAYDFAKPVAIADLISDLSSKLREWQAHTGHPDYFGLFNPGVTEAGIAADLMVAGFNPQMAAWSHAPFACEVDRHSLLFIASRLGLPSNSAAFFTSGGAEANLSAVCCALNRTFPEFADRGARALHGDPTIYLSAEAHHSFDKAAKICGIGESAIRSIPVDANFEMDVDALRSAIEDDRDRGRLPFLVVATVGTTACGAIDPLAELRALCDSESLWLHADAAWAGAICLSERRRQIISGIEMADSVTFDAHKWLQVPMGAGMFFCRHPDVPLKAFGISTSYMPDRIEDTVDPYLNTPQWSRRFTGLKVFLSLASLGESGYAEMIDRMCDLGDHLKSRLTETGWRIVSRSPLPLAVFTRAEILGREKEFLERLYARRDSWLSVASLSNGESGLRACICSHATEVANVDRLIATLSDELSRFA
jgi:glutamate/tyrosine decarboxylase-like PLP-dependent enzyme